MRSSGRQAVDEGFDAVLCAYGAGNRRNDSAQDHQMRRETTPEIAQDKGKWPARVSRNMIHLIATPSYDSNFVTGRLNIDRFASVPGRSHHDMRMRTI